MILFFEFSAIYAQDEAICDVNNIQDKKLLKQYEEAKLAYQQLNYRKALNICKEILLLHPGFGDVVFMTGFLYYQDALFNVEEAEKYFIKSLEYCPNNNIYAYFYLAQIKMAFGEYKLAVRYLEKFLEDVDRIKTDEDYHEAIEMLEYAEFINLSLSNPVEFNPQKIKSINTKQDEYAPYLSVDNKKLYFTRKVMVPSAKKPWEHGAVFKEVLMVSLNTDTGFAIPKKMQYPFNYHTNEGSITITPDHRHLFYSVCIPDENTSYLNCDIYYSFFDGQWSLISPLDTCVNKKTSWESQPSISPDGNTLFFVSNRPDGFGETDIYMSTKDSTGNWTMAKNIGDVINTSGNERNPFMHPDGKTFYFSSDGHLTLGGFDLYFSKFENGAFSKPVNLGYPINDSENNEKIIISTDGNYGYISSKNDGPDDHFEIYRFILDESIKPEPQIFISGFVRNEFDFIETKAKIALYNLETDSTLEVSIDSLEGFFYKILPFENTWVLGINKPRHFPFFVLIDNSDSNFLFADERIVIRPLNKQKKYIIPGLSFEKDSYQLTKKARLLLDQYVNYFIEHPEIRFEIIAHTDDIGTKAQNKTLTEKQARQIFTFFKDNGISTTRMKYSGQGESNPISDNYTKAGRLRNNRIEISLIDF